MLGRSGFAVLPISMPMPWTIAGTLGPFVAALLLWRGGGGGVRGAVARLLRPTVRGAAGAIAGVLLVGATFVLGTALILTRGRLGAARR